MGRMCQTYNGTSPREPSYSKVRRSLMHVFKDNNKWWTVSGIFPYIRRL